MSPDSCCGRSVVVVRLNGVPTACHPWHCTDCMPSLAHAGAAPAPRRRRQGLHRGLALLGSVGLLAACSPRVGRAGTASGPRDGGLARDAVAPTRPSSSPSTTRHRGVPRPRRQATAPAASATSMPRTATPWRAGDRRASSVPAAPTPASTRRSRGADRRRARAMRQRRRRLRRRRPTPELARTLAFIAASEACTSPPCGTCAHDPRRGLGGRRRGRGRRVYAYSVAGAHVPAAARRRALDGLDAHRANRSRAASAVVAAAARSPGRPPPTSCPSRSRPRDGARPLMAQVDNAPRARSYADAAAGQHGRRPPLGRPHRRRVRDPRRRLGRAPRRPSPSGPYAAVRLSRSQPSRRMSTPTTARNTIRTNPLPRRIAMRAPMTAPADVARAHEQAEAATAPTRSGRRRRCAARLVPRLTTFAVDERIEERVAEAGDEDDEQERAGAGADEAVVEADRQPGRRRRPRSAGAGPASAAPASGPSRGRSSVHSQTATSSTTMTGRKTSAGCGWRWRRPAPRPRRPPPPSAAPCARRAGPCGRTCAVAAAVPDHARRPCSWRGPRRAPPREAPRAARAAAAARRRRDTASTQPASRGRQAQQDQRARRPGRGAPPAPRRSSACQASTIANTSSRRCAVASGVARPSRHLLARGSRSAGSRWSASRPAGRRRRRPTAGRRRRRHSSAATPSASRIRLERVRVRLGDRHLAGVHRSVDVLVEVVALEHLLVVRPRPHRVAQHADAVAALLEGGQHVLRIADRRTCAAPRSPGSCRAPAGGARR